MATFSTMAVRNTIELVRHCDDVSSVRACGMSSTNVTNR